jgi:CHAT domain-containing protein
MKDARRLLICPDGPLHYLPFAALRPSPDAYLVEARPVSYVLSATVYGELTRSQERPRADLPVLVAFGDPVYPPPADQESSAETVLPSATRGPSFSPLPSTRTEVESIRALYDHGVQVFLGPDAREEEAKKLTGARIVHFACHGFLDHRFPLNSGLALTIPSASVAGADNGLFQAWEIFESSRLQADLVTLSACQSGLGKEMGGEGLIGLTRAFQYAGARAVLSTLWSVADESTAVFMRQLYSYLSQGHAKAEALRLAQLDFIRSRRTAHQESMGLDIDVSHPFYWACFVLDGE